MKKLILLLLIVISFNSFAQNNYFYPLSEGTTLVYKFYYGDGNIIKIEEEDLWIKYTVKEFQKYKDSTVMYINMDVSILNKVKKAEKIKNLPNDFMSLKCKQYKDSVYTENFIVNMLTSSMAMDSQNTSFDFKDIPKITIPLKLKVGQELPDCKMMDVKFSMDMPVLDSSEIEMLAFDMSNISVVAEYKNRKVEKKEKIETPCGKFTCYKITYDNFIDVSMGIMCKTIQEKMSEWVCPKIGMIKMEKYDENGNLSFVQVLEEYKK